MQALEHQIVDFLTQLMQSIGWPGVVVIMALESANIPIPSELTMPLAGWLLVQARGGTAFQAVWQGGLYGALGCTIGSVVSYWLGAWGGRPLLERYGRYLFIRHSDLEQADRWFARWGDWAAFISRLLPIVRTFISFPAGVTRMRFSTFTIYTFVGSYIWCGALAWGGYLFGEHWEELRAIMRPFDVPVGLAIVASVWWYIHRRRRLAREEQRRVTGMPTFCGACGARATQPDQAFCTECGARMAPSTAGAEAASGHPLGPASGSPADIPARRPRTQPVRGWEVAAIAVIGVVWIAAAVWWVAALTFSLALGQQLGPDRLLQTVAVTAIPPLAIVAFFAARQAGFGGWRWALPLLIAVPILMVAIPALVPQSPLGQAAPVAAPVVPTQPAPATVATPTPAGQQAGGAATQPPANTPLSAPVPTGTPLAVVTPASTPRPTNTPLTIALPTSISLPNLPVIGNTPTPVPDTKLSADQARQAVKDSLPGRCVGVEILIDLAQSTYEAPNWVVTILPGDVWRVDDGTSAVVPDEKAAARAQRECGPGRR